MSRPLHIQRQKWPNGPQEFERQKGMLRNVQHCNAMCMSYLTLFEPACFGDRCQTKDLQLSDTYNHPKLWSLFRVSFGRFTPVYINPLKGTILPYESWANWTKFFSSWENGELFGVKSVVPSSTLKMRKIETKLARVYSYTHL